VHSGGMATRFALFGKGLPSAAELAEILQKVNAKYPIPPNTNMR
jgi:hypothetical protein